MKDFPEIEGRLEKGTALVAVDVQNDFCPGGALPVPGGDRVVPFLNEVAAAARAAGCLVIFTRDWHPPRHVSFVEKGGSWPSHCVSGSRGAAFHPALDVRPGDLVVSKAMEEDRDAYSAFEGTDLARKLRVMGIGRLLVGGLATEYCVRATVLDGLKEGFETAVLLEGIAGIEAAAGDVEKALRVMEEAGAVLLGRE